MKCNDSFSFGQQPRPDYTAARLREQVAALQAQLAAANAQRDEAREASKHWLGRVHALGDELDEMKRQANESLLGWREIVRRESEALFARNGDVARLGKQLDELLLAADRACKQYGSRRGRVIPAMEALGQVVEAIAAAEQGGA